MAATSAATLMVLATSNMITSAYSTGAGKFSRTLSARPRPVTRPKLALMIWTATING